MSPLTFYNIRDLHFFFLYEKVLFLFYRLNFFVTLYLAQFIKFSITINVIQAF